MLNNVKSNFSFNEMNKKDLPALYFTVFHLKKLSKKLSSD